jgi:predicted MarR family transcription regulator
MKRTPVATRKSRSRRLAELSHDPSPAHHQDTQRPISRDLSEFEYSLIVGAAAFARWVERCMVVAGTPGLATQDILILHAVNHRARGRKLSDICMVMHIEDPHVVSYALKKLMAHGLVDFEKRGRERHYATTARGDTVCNRYRQTRDRMLVDIFAKVAIHDDSSAAANFLRTMTALYDQAARLATVEHAPAPPASL